MGLLYCSPSCNRSRFLRAGLKRDAHVALAETLAALVEFNECYTVGTKLPTGRADQGRIEVEILAETELQCLPPC